MNRNDNSKKLYEYYNRLDNLIMTGVNENVYGVYDVDEEILSDFFELFCEYPKENEPDWLETYIQLYSWQFQNYHEGVETYYENLYEFTGYNEIKKAENYLKSIGYIDLARYIALPNSKVPFEKKTLEEKEQYKRNIINVTDWIESNNEIIFKAYVDILIRNKNEIISCL